MMMKHVILEICLDFPPYTCRHLAAAKARAEAAQIECESEVAGSQRRRSPSLQIFRLFLLDFPEYKMIHLFQT